MLHPSEKPQEIFIMDTPDMNSAQRVWRWNLSGLGYSSAGIKGPFELAMTMDGAIIADFITAGTINGALIKAGSVEAESLSQEYKQSVTDAINDVESSVTQAFQAADGKLSSTISETYLTKNSASSTYATKTALTQTASEISTEVSKKVDNSEFATKITQNAYSVRVAWNNNSNYIQLESGQLAIYNGSLDLTNGVLCSMVRGRTGQSRAMVLSEQLAFLRGRSIIFHGLAQISESDIIYTTK